MGRSATTLASFLLSQFSHRRAAPALHFHSALALLNKPNTRQSANHFCPRSSNSAQSPPSVESKALTTREATTEGMWAVNDDLAKEAREELKVWPLDENNVVLLNEVHPRNYTASDEPHEVYDLLVIGAGAGGLVSSRQAARRGAKSCMISEHLAGGDCLNVGCVPSKALIRSARAASEVRKAASFGVVLPPGEIKVDFPAVMERMRNLRAKIAPVDGHAGTASTGAHVFQGRGKFTGKHTVEVNGKTLTFKKAVLAMGGRPGVPKGIPGLAEAPYTTNEVLFNLETLPPRMVVLGAGVIALEMAQTFASFGSKVTVIQRSSVPFASKGGDEEAGKLIKEILEEDGIKFVSGKTKEVKTIRKRGEGPDSHPLMTVTVTTADKDVDLDCECLLVATGRVANVENMGLEKAGIEFEPGKGILTDDLARSVSHPDVYAVGDCCADVPRLTHMSGEMAKLVVQNALFDDSWKVSSLVVPAVMYTEPEYATVGHHGLGCAEKAGVEVDVYGVGLEHNDRAILESNNRGFAKIFCKKGTDEIVGATVVASRAGEIINEISLAMKHGVGLAGIGRNIHAYPTTGEAVMMCGVQFINSRWKKFGES